jgi:hypothetical protein
MVHLTRSDALRHPHRCAGGCGAVVRRGRRPPAGQGCPPKTTPPPPGPGPGPPHPPPEVRPPCRPARRGIVPRLPPAPVARCSSTGPPAVRRTRSAGILPATLTPVPVLPARRRIAWRSHKFGPITYGVRQFPLAHVKLLTWLKPTRKIESWPKKQPPKSLSGERHGVSDRKLERSRGC